MTEVGVVFEEFNLSSWVDGTVSTNNLSFSPLALIITGGSRSGFDASVDEINICSQVFWSTVVVIWNQVGSVIPSALKNT